MIEELLLNQKILFNQDRGKWLVSIITLCIGIISLIIFIGAARVGIICLFSNPSLAKSLFGIFLFCPVTFSLLMPLLFIVDGAFVLLIEGDGMKALENSKKIFINAIIASFTLGIFVLLSDLTLLKVPFGLHLLLSYSFLWLLLFCLGVYRKWLAMPEQERTAQFIELLEDLLPREYHEECLGDVRENYHKLIKEGIPRSELSRITLLTGLGVIRYYLWLKFHKLVSRWITRA